jgi:hypothetical protein
VDCLDAQDPAVLAKLRTLEVGHAPTGGWREFLAAAPTTPVAPATPVTPATPWVPATTGAATAGTAATT